MSTELMNVKYTKMHVGGCVTGVSVDRTSAVTDACCLSQHSSAKATTHLHQMCILWLL